jgi:hypothetical protein
MAEVTLEIHSPATWARAAASAAPPRPPGRFGRKGSHATGVPSRYLPKVPNLRSESCPDDLTVYIATDAGRAKAVAVRQAKADAQARRQSHAQHGNTIMVYRVSKAAAGTNPYTEEEELELYRLMMYKPGATFLHGARPPADATPPSPPAGPTPQELHQEEEEYREILKGYQDRYRRGEHLIPPRIDPSATILHGARPPVDAEPPCPQSTPPPPEEK